MSNSPLVQRQYSSNAIFANATTGIAATQHQHHHQQLHVVSPVVSPVPPRQQIAMNSIPTIQQQQQQQQQHVPQYNNNNNNNSHSPLPHYDYANPVNHSQQHPVHVHNATMAWQQQQLQLHPHPLLLPQAQAQVQHRAQAQAQQQQQPQPNFTQQQQHGRVQIQPQLQMRPQTMASAHPTRGDISDDNSDDVSSIPWGSIRPDPRYDPANDPLHPANMAKPFVPPLEITITMVRGRRRKNMENHNHHTQYPITSTTTTTTSSPKQRQQRSHRRSQTQTTQASSAEWLRLEVSPLVSNTETGSDGIPMLGRSISFPMDVSNTNPADSKNNGNGIDDGSGSRSRSRTVEQLQEQFSDLATHADVNNDDNVNININGNGNGNGNGTSDQQSDNEEYLELRGGLLELQKLQELQNSFCYDGIEVKAGDDESEEADVINNNNTSMEVIADFAPQQPQQQQRKGMVRREFGRRVMRFKKKIYNNKDDNINSNKDPIPDLGGSNTNDDDSDNDVGHLVVKPSKMKMGINKAMHSYSPFAATNYYNKSKMMTMVSGQENGC